MKYVEGEYYNNKHHKIEADTDAYVTEEDYLSATKVDTMFQRKLKKQSQSIEYQLW